MDYLILCAKIQEKLHPLIDTVKIFSSNIKVTLVLTNVHIRIGEVKNRQRKYKDIEKMRPEETYTYLEIPQKQQVDHSYFKKIFTEKDRKSHNNFEHQVISEKPDDSTQYMGKSCTDLFFWNNQRTDTDLEGHDRLTRRLLTKFCCLHPNSSIKRLYLPWKEGG